MARRRPQPEGPGRKGPPGGVARRRQPEIGLSPPRSWAPRASWSGGPFRPGAVVGHSQTEPSAGHGRPGRRRDGPARARIAPPRPMSRARLLDELLVPRVVVIPVVEALRLPELEPASGRGLEPDQH